MILSAEHAINVVKEEAQSIQNKVKAIMKNFETRIMHANLEYNNQEIEAFVAKNQTTFESML